MKINKTLFKQVAFSAMIIGFIIMIVPSRVYAATITCDDGTTREVTDSNFGEEDNRLIREGACGAAGYQGSAESGPTAPVTSDTEYQEFNFEDDSQGCNEAALTQDNCRIVSLLVMGINILSALAGMAIIASIMIAGFQYMTAQGNASQIQAARKRIVWALTALVLFIFMYALLNFFVPGGVL